MSKAEKQDKHTKSNKGKIKMDKKQLISHLENEYDTFNTRARDAFDRWLETGAKCLEREELSSLGAAYAVLRIIKLLDPQNKIRA